MSTWVGQTFTTIDSGSSSWVPSVGSPTDGNLMLLFVLADDTQLVALGSTTAGPTVSGWTELHPNTARSAGGDCSGFLFWKVAGASESNPTVTWTGTPQGLCHVVEVSGQDGSTPINGSNFAVTGAGATFISIPGITTTVNNCLLVAFAGVDESSTSYAPYWTDPMVSGWTARYGSSSVPNTLGGSSTYSGIASTTQATAGATGNVSATIDLENDAIVGYLVAVAPAGAPPAVGSPPLKRVPMGSLLQM